ncbi:MAG: OmpH family outer membrane protein [Bacteroidales bacterium]|jgi:Skp family chaperone for outer membrane proteins|nr:OmpH family outer membrane protein [Bacteroidales bacterium]
MEEQEKIQQKEQEMDNETTETLFSNEEENINEENNVENEETFSHTEDEKDNEKEAIQSVEPNTVSAGNKKRKITCILHLAGYGIIVAAVIVLYVLHFSQPKKAKPIPLHTGDPSQALIITVNTDSVEKHFELMELLRKDLEKETESYQMELQTKSAKFQEKYQNYMINVQNNVLTQTQMENAERQLLQEKNALEELNERYTQIIAKKEMSVQTEIMDSLKNAAKRVNEANYNADYIFAINAGSAVLHASELYDITDEVIEELNNSYKKSKK